MLSKVNYKCKCDIVVVFLNLFVKRVIRKTNVLLLASYDKVCSAWSSTVLLILYFLAVSYAVAVVVIVSLLDFFLCGCYPS